MKNLQELILEIHREWYKDNLRMKYEQKKVCIVCVQWLSVILKKDVHFGGTDNNTDFSCLHVFVW